MMASDGSDPVRLTRLEGADSNPSWSPDGARIAFDSVRQGRGDIFVMNPDGQGLRNLTRHPSDDIGPQWSPDGSTIAYLGNQDAGEICGQLIPTNPSFIFPEPTWCAQTPYPQMLFLEHHIGNHVVYL